MSGKGRADRFALARRGLVLTIEWSDSAYFVERESAQSPFVLVCEHASAFIPEPFEGLGLPEALREAHIAWDPGALDLARRLSQRLDAPLLAAGISRLVYDCNRPPESASAVPVTSEIFDVPGNRGLSQQALRDRADRIYHPFHAALERLLAGRPNAPVLVTVHSFTPVYLGQARDTEIGILHDADARMADSMLAMARRQARWRVLRNAPYGPEDGVTHTLRRHALPGGLLNVMIEVRNDLLATPQDRAELAELLGEWIASAAQSHTEGEALS